MTEKLTAAEQYRQSKSNAEVEIVDVKVPSGFVFQFQKPSKYGVIFKAGQLPQYAASGAIDKWSKEGILKGLSEGDPDTKKMASIAFGVRDRVLELSHSPKLVVGPADPKKNELSTDDVSDDDMSYLWAWVQAGGEESMMLGTFPGRSPSSPVVGPNRAQRRAKTKSTSRRKG